MRTLIHTTMLAWKRVEKTREDERVIYKMRGWIRQLPTAPFVLCRNSVRFSACACTFPFAIPTTTTTVPTCRGEDMRDVPREKKNGLGPV